MTASVSAALRQRAEQLLREGRIRQGFNLYRLADWLDRR